MDPASPGGMTTANSTFPSVKDSASATTPAGAPGHRTALPLIDIRLTAVYAWLVIGFGCLCFLLGLVLATLHHGRDLRFGLVLSAISLATAIGGNYWRKHLHIVAQLTPQQLILRRDGPVNWGEIEALDSKRIHAFNHGVRHESRFVCIKLKNRPPAKNGMHAFFLKAKQAISGYDIILGESELSCTTEWFIDECRKRMAAVGPASLEH
jgi:hypothetical protein